MCTVHEKQRIFPGGIIYTLDSFYVDYCRHFNMCQRKNLNIKKLLQIIKNIRCVTNTAAIFVEQYAFLSKENYKYSCSSERVFRSASIILCMPMKCVYISINSESNFRATLHSYYMCYASFVFLLFTVCFFYLNTLMF